MADVDKDQKTEAPTEKRLEDARKKGDTPMAAEFKHAAVLTAILIVVGGLGAQVAGTLTELVSHFWGRADDLRTGGAAFTSVLIQQVGLALLPLAATLVICALGGGLIQGRPSLVWSRVKPKFSKLMPHEGLKRLFGPRALVEFAKTLAKLVVVVSVAMLALWPKAVSIDRMVGAKADQIANYTGDLVLTLVMAVALFVAALALFDIIYQRQSWLKRQRMSLQEVRDEHKDSEGDPKVKARVRQLQQERARSRMMQRVPKASVIVTNPTHYSIALLYDGDSMLAPIVVAKGVDKVALRIRELAGEAGVPIMESPPLARALYASVDLEQPIPIEHYAAVAEIIGRVMRLAAAQRR